MAYEQTKRTTLRRKADRAKYDRGTVHNILNEGLIAHVGFPSQGSMSVLPMSYARVGEQLYLHGSAGNALLKAATQSEVCVTVTLLDGLVLARSTFHHSMNYRSVVIYGKPRLIEDLEEKAAALEAFVEHIIPGRTEHTRAANKKELQKTAIIALELSEVSAKVRTGDPIDDAEDMELPIWAGVIPLTCKAGQAYPDMETAKAKLRLPSYAEVYKRPGEE